MKRILFSAALLAVLLLPAAGSATASDDPSSPRHFIAQLSGGQEVPPVATDATGTAAFRLSDDGTKLRFFLSTEGLDRITQAHIHLAPAGQNGLIVAFLFPLSASGVNGEGFIVAGTLTSQDLVGPLVGQPFDSLIAAMRSGNAYVNVHTIAHPGGEIRGQIRATGFDGGS